MWSGDAARRRLSGRRQIGSCDEYTATPRIRRLPMRGTRTGGAGKPCSFRQASLDYTVQFTICRVTPDTPVEPPEPFPRIRTLYRAGLLYPSSRSWVLILAEFREGRVSACVMQGKGHEGMVPAGARERPCRWSGCTFSALAYNSPTRSPANSPHPRPHSTDPSRPGFYLLRCNVLNTWSPLRTVRYRWAGARVAQCLHRRQHTSAASFSSAHAGAQMPATVTQTSRKPRMLRLLHGRHGRLQAEVRLSQRWIRYDARRILLRLF